MKENRMIRLANVELRASEENEKKNFVEGIACVFDQETQIGWFYEKIDRHAFDNCDMSDVVLNFNHNDDILLARTTNKSLELKIDDNGLHQSASIIDTTQGNDIFKQVKEGLITKMSFSFVISNDGEEWVDDTHRVIRSIKKLYDVSLVSFPAYEQTEVFARKEGMIDELAECHRKEIEMAKETRAEEVVETETPTIEEVVEEQQKEEVVENVEETTETENEGEKVEEPKAEEQKEEVVEEKSMQKNDKEKETRQMENKNLSLEKQVSTEQVEARKEIEIKETRDSAENLKQFRNGIMNALKENRAGVKSSDAGVPVPTAWFEGVEKAWEKLDIITEASFGEFKGILYQAYEVSADGAVVHQEGAVAPNEENLTLGSILVKPWTIKKFITITDELLAMTDDAFIRYIAEEVSYRVFKKAQDEMVAGAGHGTNNDEGMVGITTSSLTTSITDTLGFNSVNSALGLLENAGDNPVVIVNRKTFFNDFMGLTDQQGRPIYQVMSDNEGKPRYFLNGIRVKFSDVLDDYGNADAGDVWAIVGNLAKYKVNAPNGKEPTLLYDPYTQATADKEVIIGKWFVGGAVVAPKAFAKLVKPTLTNKKAEAK